MLRPLLAVLAAASFAVVPACSGASDAPGGAPAADGGAIDATPSGCAADPRVTPWGSGASATGPGGTTVTVVAAQPSPPNKGRNAWTVKLTDASGTPVDGAVFTVKPFMPDHGHGAPDVPTVTPGGGPGVYTVDDITMFMPGVWQVTFTLTSPATDAVIVGVCIEG